MNEVIVVKEEEKALVVEDIDIVLEALLDGLDADDVAMAEFFTKRVRVNSEFAHKSLFDCEEDFLNPGKYVVSLAGILNGVLTALGIQMVEPVWSKDETSYGTRHLVGFAEVEDE